MAITLPTMSASPRPQPGRISLIYNTVTAGRVFTFATNVDVIAKINRARLGASTLHLPMTTHDPSPAPYLAPTTIMPTPRSNPPMSQAV